MKAVAPTSQDLRGKSSGISLPIDSVRSTIAVLSQRLSDVEASGILGGGVYLFWCISEICGKSIKG